jgi:hypothetical protein
MRIAGLSAALIALAVAACGCASPNVNPPRPKARTGYVDFFTSPPEALAWEVRMYGATTNKFKTVYFDVRPVEGGVLRLAFPPGRHQLRVTCVNRVVFHPAEIEVEVRDGRITPLRITLTEAGIAMVRTKEQSTGSTAYGRYGRRTKIDSDETMMFDVSVTADAPIEYQPRDRLLYAL